MTIYLTVERDNLVAHVRKDGSTSRKHTVRSIEDIRQLQLKLKIPTVMCSSSLDFPYEYTKSKRVISLCDLIRNGPIVRKPKVIEAEIKTLSKKMGKFQLLIEAWVDAKLELDGAVISFDPCLRELSSMDGVQRISPADAEKELERLKVITRVILLTATATEMKRVNKWKDQAYKLQVELRLSKQKSS